jgi:hypothetical protein
VQEIIRGLTRQEKAVIGGLREVGQIRRRELLEEYRGERRQQVLERLQSMGPVAEMTRKDYRKAKDAALRLLRTGR